MNSIYIENLKEHLDLFSKLDLLEEKLTRVSEIVIETFKNNNKLMICGNGGSAADSQHMAAEFTGRFIKDRAPLPALALSTDSSALTCIGNDYSFNDVFSRQVNGLGVMGDCLIGISTSGNSKNIINAINSANAKGIKTIGILGNDGGELLNLCSISLVIDSSSTARIQEAHLLIEHTIVGMVEKELGLV